MPPVIFLNLLVTQFSKKHEKLLSEIELLATNVIEVIGGNFVDFSIGYHASPSMQRAHLHVISRDYDSTCLKTKTHWNSFTTSFFRPMIGECCRCLNEPFITYWLHIFADIHNEIRRKGRLEKPSDITCKQLLSSELQCHRCRYKPKNMPDLKSHIIKPHG